MLFLQVAPLFAFVRVIWASGNQKNYVNIWANGNQQNCVDPSFGCLIGYGYDRLSRATCSQEPDREFLCNEFCEPIFKTQCNLPPGDKKCVQSCPDGEEKQRWIAEMEMKIKISCKVYKRLKGKLLAEVSLLTIYICSDCYSTRSQQAIAQGLPVGNTSKHVEKSVLEPATAGCLAKNWFRGERYPTEFWNHSD